MKHTIWSMAAVCGLALAAVGPADAERPSPFRDERRYDDAADRDESRRDFIRGGHVNIGIIFGPGRGEAPYPDAGRHPDRYPDQGCYDCGDDRRDGEWRREEAKRRAEWDREEAKRYYEHQREADKRYAEQIREEDKRFWEQEREASKRHAELEREAWKRQAEFERERRKR